MDADDGLRYELAAVVGRRGVLERLARAHPDARVAGLDVGDLALLPVLPPVTELTLPALCALGLVEVPGGSREADSRRRDLVTGRESGFTVLTPALAALIEAASVLAALAYIEADYQEQHGRQAAAVWRCGRLVRGPELLGPNEAFDPATAPISVALSALGVPGHPAGTFLLAGLGRYRRTARWASAAGADPFR